MSVFLDGTKSPHHYAAEIAKLKTREERRAALEGVPPHFQQTVRVMVENTLRLAWHWRDRIRADPFRPVPPRIETLLKELGIME